MPNAVFKTLCLAPALALAPAAFAHEIEAPAKTPAQIKPLSQADIAQIQAQMPDFNKMMAGLQTLMQDEKLQGSMKSALGAMSGAMDGADLKAKTDNGMPDFNALTGVMLSMMGDEQVMGKMLETLEPMQEALPKIMQDAMPQTQVPEVQPEN